ncbi:hypothetical protein H6P81_004505 [Aristolochia fimbriata]|uniref:BHLH domain-containing protein n=1 Tax=Aristolochia fimbriata TaxID=158543 RepID=A0AAV7FFK1_ARIFI|nr:hypothetical protein H6P81_004505 [Aristolochia fimbriata]
MPLSEIHQIPKRRHELFSSNLPFEPEHEFVELLWENGQIVMQGQSAKAKKISPTTNSSNPSRAIFEKDGGDRVLPKIGRYESNLDPSMNELSSSGHVGVEEDNMVPWLRYPVDDSLQKGHCSDFLTDMAGIKTNSISAGNGVVPIDRNRNYSQAVQGDLLVRTNSSASLELGNSFKTIDRVSEGAKARSTKLFYSTPSTAPNFKSKLSSWTTDTKGSDQAPCANSGQTEPPSSAPMQTVAALKKDPKSLQPNNGSGVINFSHFSRPAAIVRAHLQSIDRLKSDESVRLSKSSNCNTSNELSLGETACGRSTQRKVAQPPFLPAHVDLENSSTKSLPRFTSGNATVNLDQEDLSKNDRCRSPDQIPSPSFAASVAAKKVGIGKVVEPVVASSSVCSGGTSAGAAPNDPKDRFKRKRCEMEESECQSEDVEDECIEARKQTSGRVSSAKKSRAAEVHNLSERRRRDRINEKMRALQELIPNCNKVDKASMLDEAIEYLKSLQLQVQIMSMGPGLCMPPVILPTGIQPMHMPHIPHFSPIGVGIGMGMGVSLGMGMLDMCGTSGRPLIPVPPMPGAQFPYSSIPGPPNLQRMAGAGLQMFGIPGQAFSTSVPGGPYIPLSGFSGKVASTPDMLAASGAPLTESSGPPSGSKDLTSRLNVLAPCTINSVASHVPASTQPTKDCGEQLDLVEGSDPNTHASGNGCINSTTGGHSSNMTNSFDG